MLPKFCAGPLSTDFKKGDVLASAQNFTKYKICMNFSQHPTSNYLLYPFQYPAYALAKAYVL